MDKFALINKYYVEMLAYFLDKLKSTGICWITPWFSTAAE